jgi:peptidoglycan/LPS O-acetylase OafA/YrhL
MDTIQRHNQSQGHAASSALSGMHGSDQGAEPIEIKYRHLPTLDGWRAVAIVMVIVSHARSPLFVRPGWVHSVAPFGRLGVDIFFAISGLLICSRLLDEMSHNNLDLRAFYIRRLFRILPPYLFYLIVLAILTGVGEIAVTPKDFLVCVAFLRNYFMAAPLSVYTNHFWSLAVEEHFYLFWPAMLGWLGRRRAVPFALVMCLGIHAWRAATARSTELADLFPNTGLLWRTDTRLDALLWGCLAALLLQPLSRVPLRLSMTMPVVAGLVIATWRKAPMLPLIYAVGFAVLVLSTVLKPTSAAGRLLERPPVRWVGRLSYSLYIWQTIFFEQQFPSGWLGYLQRPPVNLLALVVCALASYYLLEKPTVALGRRLAGRWRLRSVAPSLSGQRGSTSGSGNSSVQS